MKIPANGVLLRIFIGEADRWDGKPLYQEIVSTPLDQDLEENLAMIRGGQVISLLEARHSSRVNQH